MPMRIRQSAAMMAMVLALFLIMGNAAQAKLSDWLWPFGSQQPREQTPLAIAQETPPMGTAPQPQPTGTFPSETPPMPPVNSLPPGNTAPFVSPSPEGQPKQFNNQQQFNNQPVIGDQFFCNSLGRMASRSECDAADRAKGFQPGQQGEVKPPFPQVDEERMKKERDEKFRMESEQSRKQFEEKMQQEERMKKGQTIQQQKGPMLFPGQGNTQGQFPGQGATQGEFPGGKEGQRPTMEKNQLQQPQQFNFDEQGEQPRQVFIDPQFVKQVAREMADQTRELNRLLKTAKKLAGAEAAVAQIQELLNKINDYKTKMKAAAGEDLQTLIEEFHDEQIWDTVNALRAQIELPKQLKEMETQLKKTENLIKQKSFQRIAGLGVDFAKITADIASFREKVNNVRSLLGSGSTEEAQDAMQEIWSEGTHPGEIQGVLQQLRGFSDNTRRIRNKEVLALVKEVFAPVIEAINDGDYREANQLLNELQFEMQRVFAQLYRLTAKSKLSTDLKSKLEAFEGRIQDKLQKQGSDEQQSIEAFPLP